MAKHGLMFALATVVLVGLATYYFASSWLPPLVSDRLAIDEALATSLLVTGLVFIATNLLLAWLSWRYTDREGAQAAYWHDNPKLEWTWTLVTAGVLAVILFGALNLWASIQAPPPKDAYLVEVTAQQFAWNVRMPGPDGVFGRTDAQLVDTPNLNFIGLDRNDPAAADDVVLPQNTMFLPEGRPVLVRLRSLDVLHSFFLPQFRVKQDAVPGMAVDVWFVPKQSGQYEIACAEHCGLGHYRMRGRVQVVPPAELESRIQDAVQ